MESFPVVDRLTRLKPVSSRLRLATRTWTLEKSLFCLALLVYLSTRLIGLSIYPIYFFTDEAVQTVMAADFVRDGLRNHDKEFLPTYFSNGPTYNLSSVSVYLQVLPYLLFGRTVLITRAVSVLISLLAAVWVGLILRDIFKISTWWSGALLLSISPAWFFHSRTAFETVEMTAFYAGFIYFYLLYRTRSPRCLYPALLLGALVFYTYSPGQLIIVATGILLLIIDIRYHWENRLVALGGLGLLAILALPYLRFQLSHSGVLSSQLAARAPYWFEPIPLVDKLKRLGEGYFASFSPAYWFLPNERDLPRHLMKGYGHIPAAFFPFFLTGLAGTAWRWRQAPYRTLLAALAAAPVGAAPVGVGITRLLVVVLLAAIFTAAGLSWALDWITRQIRQQSRGDRPSTIQRFWPNRSWLAVGLFLPLALFNFFMLGDALLNGPTWYTDYGLGGMQYGARQVFAAIEERLQQSPQTKILLTPTWANGTDVVARFFLGDPLPISLGSIEGHLSRKQPLDDEMLFILTPEEYEMALSSPKFKTLQVERTLPYPDGRPGFYFIHLQYADNIDQILAEERDSRRRLLDETIEIDGKQVNVRHPHLDMGEIGFIFDDNRQTVARTLDANPFIVELTFPQPVTIDWLAVLVGNIEAQLDVAIIPFEGDDPLEYSIRQQCTVEQPEVHLDFGQVLAARAVRLKITDVKQGEPGHVHIWEVTLGIK